ncbi:hypothetical protein GYN08_08455 [Saccharibacillus sp. VR-M41]|uniref:Uncharacterized protein n=1 Tax=Saccharibacillus alkalitolerans TaxID=2705290 RepID=A0ABX0F5T0_9BACL|nr:hypothetical protein [Saccharibacillus alkalitolerans]
MYAETTGPTEEADAAPLDAEALFPGAENVLSVWPGERGGRLFVPMTDIFHYRRPDAREPWRKTAAPNKGEADRGKAESDLKAGGAGGGRSSESHGRVARLKPDMTASYVFYHYQYQEEKPGDGDKYGIIGLHENLLFFYAERPATIGPPPYEGTLKTRNTPKDWGSAMQPHFIEWRDAPEGQTVWLNADRVLEARLPDQEGD